MSAHGAARPGVASKGCWALWNLANGNTSNADAIVTSTGALDAILAVMAAHPGDETLQKSACRALWIIAGEVSPGTLGALRDSAAMELLKCARRDHPKEGGGSVAWLAGQALSAIAP